MNYLPCCIVGVRWIWNLDEGEYNLSMNAILTLIAMLPFLGAILIANIAERRRDLNVLNYISLILLCLLIFGLGALGLGVGLFFASGSAGAGAPSPVLAGMDPAAQQALAGAPWVVISLILLIMSVVAGLMMITAVRRAVAYVLPIRADSPVHMAALVLTALTVGLNIWQSILLTPLATAQAATGDTAITTTYFDVLVFPLLTLTIAAVIGVGLYVRRNQDEVFERLGLRGLSFKHLLIAIITTAILVPLGLGTEMLWQQLDPAGYKQVGDLSQALLGGFSGIAGALAIGGSAAIGEEIFFRGAYQPRFGLLLSALLFASFHVQYGLSPATLLVFVIGLVLGILRQRTSLTVCMLVHFLYNATLVLIGG